MGSKSNDKCPNKSETKGELTEGRGGGSVTSEAEIGVMWPQVKECWQALETRRGNRTVSR